VVGVAPYPARNESYAHHSPCAYMHIFHSVRPTTLKGRQHFYSLIPSQPFCAPSCFCKVSPQPAPLRCIDRSMTWPPLLAHHHLVHCLLAVRTYIRCHTAGLSLGPTSTNTAYSMPPPEPSHLATASVLVGLRHCPRRPLAQATFNAVALNELH
jgi:hypothetical protein